MLNSSAPFYEIQRSSAKAAGSHRPTFSLGVSSQKVKVSLRWPHIWFLILMQGFR